MEIVAANNNDINDLFELDKKCFKEHLKISDLEYELTENPFSHTLVIKNNDEIVGYLIYWITFNSSTIFRICVNSKYRKQGLATLLIKESEKKIKEENSEFYTLEVRKNNLAAINLYKKNGFLEVCIKKGYYSNGEDAIYMVKGEI